MQYLSIFLGCGAGGLARYALSRYATEQFHMALPAGTLIVNIAGSFLIGLFFACFKDSALPSPLRLFVTTGFLGGFTTFSTYALETVQLFEKGEIRSGVINFLTHNVVGFIAVAGGILAYDLLKSVTNGGLRP